MGAASTEPFVQVEDLKLKTPLGVVYQDVSFSVGKGQVCALFGTAGCGKTALLLTACGRMKPSAGTARVAGHDLKKGYRKVRRLSAVSFIPGLNDVQPFLRVKNIMAAELSLVGKRGDKAATDDYLERCGFADKADVRFDDLDAYDAAYFGIILALASDPELLCVDDVQRELTQHQSIKLVDLLVRIARALGTTVLFCCSEYEIARGADGVVVLGAQAESQRQAVIRDQGEGHAVPIFGSGNGVIVGAAAGPCSKQERKPSFAGGEA